MNNEWSSVAEILGEERTAKLISNGTTLEVAKQMAEQVKLFREQYPILYKV